jgi:hypothetical protein
MLGSHTRNHQNWKPLLVLEIILRGAAKLGFFALIVIVIFYHHALVGAVSHCGDELDQFSI